jgi:hypothetical protein
VQRSLRLGRRDPHQAGDDAGEAGEVARRAAREPHLLEQDLPFRHWSKGAIFSPAARAGWLDPDLKPLPF